MNDRETRKLDFLRIYPPRSYRERKTKTGHSHLSPEFPCPANAANAFNSQRLPLFLFNAAIRRSLGGSTSLSFFKIFRLFIMLSQSARHFGQLSRCLLIATWLLLSNVPSRCPEKRTFAWLQFINLGSLHRYRDICQ